MRTLTFIIQQSQNHLEDVRLYIGGLIAERTGIADSVELATRTDLTILWLNCMGAFGCVKRISYAVGHADLSKTYTRLLADRPSLSTRMIDATIKLDHFVRVPETELRGIAADIKDNKFAAHVMRDLVADFIYLYNNDFKTMQMLGSMWNIDVSAPRMLASVSKK